MVSRVLRSVAVSVTVGVFLLTFLAYVGLYTSPEEAVYLAKERQARYRAVARPEVGTKGTRSFNSKSNHRYKGETLQSEPTLGGRPPPEFDRSGWLSSGFKGQNEGQNPLRKLTTTRETHLKETDNQNVRPKPIKANEENKQRKGKPMRKSSNSNASQAKTSNLGTANQSAEAVEKTCTRRKFFKCCQPVTALASFQGSGSTWVRHLLEQATGYYTGSVYEDRVLEEAGFKGEGRRNGTVLAVKTHVFRSTIEVKYERVILLTRSPLDCLLAEFKRTRGGGHTGYADQEAYQNFTLFFIKYSFFGQRLHEYWYSQDLPMLVVRYEDLKTDLRQQVKRMVKFLDLPITEERLDCVVENSEGKFHRKSQTGGSADNDPFDSTLKDVVEDLEKEAGERKEAWQERTKQNKAKQKKTVEANHKAVVH